MSVGISRTCCCVGVFECLLWQNFQTRQNWNSFTFSLADEWACCFLYLGRVLKTLLTERQYEVQIPLYKDFESLMDYSIHSVWRYHYFNECWDLASHAFFCVIAFHCEVLTRISVPTGKWGLSFMFLHHPNFISVGKQWFV